MSFWNKDAKPLIGQKNVKYGLQPGSKGLQGSKLAIFNDDAAVTGRETDINTALRAQAGVRRSDAKYEKLHAQALAEDASVYDYDSYHDSIQAERESARQAAHAQEKGGPRYIHALQAAMKDREREQNIIYERRLERDRKVEDALHGDKEVFVTNAYKQKLREDQLWQASQAAKDASDAKNSAQAKGNMNGVLNLLSTALREPQAQQDALRSDDDSPERNDATGATVKDVSPDRLGGKTALAADLQKRADVKVQKAVAEMDRYELARHRAGQRLLERAKQNTEDTSGSILSGAEPSDQTPQAAQEAQGLQNSASLPQTLKDSANTGDHALGKRNSSAGSTLSNAKRRADDEVLSAAKQRYLARKVARQSGT